MAYLFSLTLLLSGWYLSTLFFGAALVPSPWQTLISLGELARTFAFWQALTLTLFRGLFALLLSVAAALLLGIPAGRKRRIMELSSPLVAALQATPPILWITLLMVWVGTGSQVPIAVVAVSLFPPLFANIAQSTAAIDQRLLDLTRVYHIGRRRLLIDILLPAIAPYFLAAFSYALGSCWKIAAVAEFLGSSQGIGARIYWSYRMLDMPQLFAWATVLIGLGMIVELALIRPLRELSKASRGPSGSSQGDNHA